MIQVTNLRYAYHKKENVFDGLSLQLAEGHIHGLFGCNGMGKSTLLKLLVGLLKPIQGQISVDGHTPFSREVSHLQQIMFLPEEIELPSVSIERYAKITAPFYPKFSADDFERYCKDFGIEPHKKMTQMSMGIRKRAYLAFALACNTPYLLLDEPTNGLDIPAKTVFRRLVAEALTEERTIIISTHQVKEVEALIDNVIIIDKQGLVLNETIEHLGEKFKFGTGSPLGEVIHTEQTPHGKIFLGESQGQETQPNIELLFNATIEHRDEIQRILKQNTQPSHE